MAKQLTPAQIKLYDSLTDEPTPLGNRNFQTAVALEKRGYCKMSSPSVEGWMIRKTDKPLPAPSKRVRQLFPKMTRGAYSVRFRFMDETRGEQFFDAEYLVQGIPPKGSFDIATLLSWDGRPLAGGWASLASIHDALDQGGSVTLTINKHNMRGVNYFRTAGVKVEKVEKTKTEYGCEVVRIHYSV